MEKLPSIKDDVESGPIDNREERKSILEEPSIHTKTTTEELPEQEIKAREAKAASRRHFLRQALGMSVGGAVAITSNTQIGRSNFKYEGRKNFENVKEIETENAKYKIVYSVHAIATNPEILNKVDAVFLEGFQNDKQGVSGTTDMIKDVASDEEDAEAIYKKHESLHGQYKEIYKTLLTNNGRLFFVDMVGNDTDKTELLNEFNKSDSIKAF